MSRPKEFLQRLWQKRSLEIANSIYSTSGGRTAVKSKDIWHILRKNRRATQLERDYIDKAFESKSAATATRVINEMREKLNLEKI